MSGDLALGEDQRDLAAMALAFADEHTDPAAVLAGADPLWTDKQLAAAGDLGLTGLLTEDGGGTHTDLAVVVEQLGRTGCALPIAPVALAAGLAESAGLRPAGLCVPAVAERGAPDITAEPAGDSLRLSGRAEFVLAGAEADQVLVLAHTAESSVVAVVDTKADGVTVTPRSILDISRRFAAVALESAVAVGWAEADTTTTREAAAVHLMADAVGAASRLLELTLEHVRTREQFGRAVGSFQAVKHHCANMAVDLELSRGAVLAAMRALDDEDPVARAFAVSSAGSFAGEACSRLAGLALQLHGGMGFTWEQPVHVFLRRIKTDELLGGTPRWHRARLLELTGANR
ncbi:acyl-CoA dehydrogenase [Amycolatopsis acidiphila]|uniref:Acyl-CoA dehydrogenase n=1 Tax=Amycolatopsis acidiphila TaxID=715473 RepID=A0A557ZZL2_9PSEU|nr:acyl-CoA dehydrogenase [Amycolatopsis acidiphila]TVT17437.1 acyl-CoA dehydrogenase [Amycolatopsis acidiphila]UIJ57286.1 acyl-CoA dehydrogenase [Amycolatopsis acidiphila]GHG52274.1 acyl-CoA dehydrogenase [Amycolatopsis acidiphila]